MRTATASLGLALVLLVSFPAGAGAQEPPHKKMAAGVSMGIVFPQGDADETAGTSPAARAQFTYWIHPMIGLVASFDWVFVSENEGVSDVTYYDLSIGGRLTTRGPARIKPFGELLIGRHSLSIDDVDYSESDIGFRLGGGATYELSASLQGFAQLTYSTVEIDFADIEAFVLEVGALARF